MNKVTDDYFINHAGKFVSVKAKPITIPGFELFDLFAHKSLVEVNGKLEQIGKWRVSEGKSGFGMPVLSNNTRASAIEAATDALSRFTPERFQEIINSSVGNCGLSPRWSLEDNMNDKKNKQEVHGQTQD